MHLVIDGYGGDSGLLGDADLTRNFLDGHPCQIGMTKIAPAQVYSYRGKKPADWGVSGFVLIAESHITVHTFPDRGYVNVDIFSCKEFSASASIDIVRRKFDLDRVESYVLDRGLEYLTNREAYAGMVRERVGLQPVESSDNP